MNFNREEIFGACLIGFDIIDGPVLKWKNFHEKNTKVNLDEFAMNFYLAFRGGNAGKKPRAILYDEFYIVAFPNNLELCCLFMKPKGIEENIKELNKIATRLILEKEESEDEGNEEKGEDEGGSDEEIVEEVRRLIVNLLNDTEMSTPELKRYFKLSNSQIWKIMSDLENSLKIKRTRKKGRSQMWTAS